MSRMDYGGGLLIIGLLIASPIIILIGSLGFLYSWQGILALLPFSIGLTMGYSFVKKITATKKTANQFILGSLVFLILATILPSLFLAKTSPALLWSISLGYLSLLLLISTFFHNSIGFRLFFVNNKNFDPTWFYKYGNSKKIRESEDVNYAEQLLAKLAGQKNENELLPGEGISKAINYIIKEIDHLEPEAAWSQLFFKYLDKNEHLLFIGYQNFYGHSSSKYNAFFVPLKQSIFFSMWTEEQLNKNETAKKLYETYLQSFNKNLQEYIEAPIDFKNFHKPLAQREIPDLVDYLQNLSIEIPIIKEDTMLLSNQLLIAHKIALQM